MTSPEMNKSAEFATVLLMLVSLGCSPLQQTASRQQTVTPWPALYAQVGPYDLRTVQEIDTVAADNFHLALIAYPGNAGAFVDAIRRNNIHYIDSYLWWTISAICAPQVTVTHTCIVTAADEQQVLAQVGEHLQLTSRDPSVVGYWVLDDYPGGDVHYLLEHIHLLIARSNATAVVKRPAICGFGGRLDWKLHPRDVGFVSYNHYFDMALVNFSSTACDMVALYPYGVNSINDPTTIDWSMASLLPHYLSGLRSKGWDQLKEPLIGMPQTFSYAWQTGTQASYVAPRQQDIATQATSYCKAGAVALLPYAWDDSYTGQKSELYNTAFMVRGLQQGVENCGYYWY